MELVTKDGEDILAAYDTWGIAELRRQKLIWSSWDGPKLDENFVPDAPGLPRLGMRRLTCSDPARFRCFFLSMLWRAAASARPEFREIAIPDLGLKRLTMMVRDGDPTPLDFFPANLLQIVSKGPNHNRAPSALKFEMNDPGVGKIRHDVFRFYFDGLITNFHRHIASTQGAESLLVGFRPDLIVQTQIFEESAQRDDMEAHIVDNHIRWPNWFERTLSRFKK